MWTQAELHAHFRYLVQRVSFWVVARTSYVHGPHLAMLTTTITVYTIVVVLFGYICLCFRPSRIFTRWLEISVSYCAIRVRSWALDVSGGWDVLFARFALKPNAICHGYARLAARNTTSILLVKVEFTELLERVKRHEVSSSGTQHALHANFQCYSFNSLTLWSDLAIVN